MSYLLPKRTNELSNFESDEETPNKNENSVTSKSTALRLPRRVAELQLESDSEDDKNDKLNCAILNDSFILSPSKEIEFGQTPQQIKNPDENNKNISNTNDSGFLSNYRPIKIRQQLFSSKTSESTEKPQDISVPSIFKKTADNAWSHDASQKHETPFKQQNDPVFLTPSVRQPSQSTIKKYQNIPLQTLTSIKEKPPAKILFTTPVARQPLSGNLIESTPLEIKKIASSAATCRKLSPIVEPTEKPNENLIEINNVEYLIDKKIGSGGSSSVFLAKKLDIDKEVAIKLVNLDGDPQVVEGYLNETKLLAKLQGNVNVVALLDYCHLPTKNILYMVMEKGESDLHKILQSYRTHLPLYTLVTYWYQMLQAVNYIHSNGVIHSDLKPANFLMIDGRLKLIDFGIASNIAIDSTSIIKFSQAGTFNYISPEALIDTSTGDSPSTHNQPKIRLSTKSDVWSLGCIMFLLLYKTTPFAHIKVIHQKVSILTNPNTVIDFPKLPNIYPPILVEMARKCLVYNPKERSSVADLLKYPFDMLIPIDPK